MREIFNFIYKVLGNPIVFVIFYILFMIPTYIMPYFGSNSLLINTAIAKSNGSINPALWIHLISMFALIFLTYFRSSLINKKWLITLPILALVFDFIPFLNLIPLVPTVMHILTLILGVSSQKPEQSKQI